MLATIVAVATVASPAAATTPAPTCPSTVIPNIEILPSAVGCWNAIAVQAVRIDTAYPPQGLLYMGYVQAAVYDAVTKIDRRYVPYEDFAVPHGVRVASASPDAATAAAAYRMLTSAFLGLMPAAQVGLSTTYSDYIDALGGMQTPAVAPASRSVRPPPTALSPIGRAIATSRSLHAGPLTPGGWTFAPLPSLQSSQTPWMAVMRPFMLRVPRSSARPRRPTVQSHVDEGLQREQGLRLG